MREISLGHHGAYGRARLQAKWGRAEIYAAMRRGYLVPYGKKVLLDRRCTSDFRCRCAAALLAVGPESVLCGHTALALHGFAAADKSTIHVLVRYSQRARSPAGAIVHRGAYAEGDVTEIDGLRVLVPEASLADVLCRAPRNIALGCADQVLSTADETERGHLKAELAARIAERPDPRGRRQANVLLELATGLPESQLESSLLLQVFDAGFPVPVPQFSIRAFDGREIWRLDFAWPDLRIALEYDGYEAHEHRADRDRQRDSDLRKRGWLIIRATAADMRDNGRLLAALRSAFTERGVHV